MYYAAPQSSITEWRMVFWISFIVFILTTIVYVLWASGETQWWNNPDKVRAVENGELEPEDKENIKLDSNIIK